MSPVETFGFRLGMGGLMVALIGVAIMMWDLISRWWNA